MWSNVSWTRNKTQHRDQRSIKLHWLPDHLIKIPTWTTPRERTPSYKWLRWSLEIFKRTPKRYQNSVLCAWSEHFFFTKLLPQAELSGWSGTNETKIIMSWLSLTVTSLKGTTIPLTEVVLDFSTLTDNKPQNLTPKRYDDHPHHFYVGVPPGNTFTTVPPHQLRNNAIN